MRPTAPRPTGVAVDDRTGRVYVTLAGDNAVAVFESGVIGPNRYDVTALRHTGSVPTARFHVHAGPGRVHVDHATYPHATYPLDAVNPEPMPGTASSVPLDLSRFDVAGPVHEAQVWEAARPGEPMPPTLLAALEDRGGIVREALAAWGRGEPCQCRPLRPGLVLAPGGDPDG